MTLKTGHKSIKAQRQKVRNKRKQIANKRLKHRKLRAKPFITLTLNTKPLCDALKKASEAINNAFGKIKMNLQKIFPMPAMLSLYLQLQMADNNRPNKYLRGWGRTNVEGLIFFQ